MEHKLQYSELHETYLEEFEYILASFLEHEGCPHDTFQQQCQVCETKRTCCAAQRLCWAFFGTKDIPAVCDEMFRMPLMTSLPRFSKNTSTTGLLKPFSLPWTMGLSFGSCAMSAEGKTRAVGLLGNETAPQLAQCSAQSNSYVCTFLFPPAFFSALRQRPAQQPCTQKFKPQYVTSTTVRPCISSISPQCN